MNYQVKKIKHPNIEINEDMERNIANITQYLISEIQRREEELFITTMRTMAKPIIKGEITKGKLLWRGIRLIRQRVGLDSYSWIEQRGKKISPTFCIKAMPDINIG